MAKLKITKCSGECQGSCKRCFQKGIWNRNWMCFLYRVEGLEGCYCEECAKFLASSADESEDDKQ